MKPFLTGRQQVSVSPLKSLDAPLSKQPSMRVAGHSHGAQAGGSAGGEDSQPTVECIRQGDKIVRLIVSCSCGERIEIECLYPAGG